MDDQQKQILEVIKHNIFHNPDSLQCYNMSLEQMFKIYERIILNNEMQYAHENGLVFLFQPFSNYMTQVHLFSNSMSSYIKNGKKLTTKVFENSNYNCLFGITTNKQFEVTCKKTGWRLLGAIPSSTVSRNGELINQYVFYALRQDFLIS